MSRNVFVLGLLDWQRQELETIERAHEDRFMPLLTFDELVVDPPGFDELLQRCRRQIDRSGVRPDAIICHWDFPSSCLAPVLAAEYSLPGPALEAVLKCEHKYWARLEQERVVAENIPRFQALDPFAPQAADDIALDYPFWLKPVKGFSSKLGFRIESRRDLDEALAQMREHIGELGRPFDDCLAHAHLPPEVAVIGGTWALAEGIIQGVQFAPEGYVQGGRVHLHGFFDMLMEEGALAALRYPDRLPRGLRERAERVCQRILGQVGYDDGCFNVEFLYDEPQDQLWVIEVNTRISQSHSELFRRVDGMSNHEVAVSVALGESPHLSQGAGRDRMAGKFWLLKHGDARVTRVPSAQELASIERELDTLIELNVAQGDRLSELPHQPVHGFYVAEVFLGAGDEAGLFARRDALIERLPIEFSDGGSLEMTR